MARALRTASLWFSSWTLGCATGRLHKNLANLSMSPLSSSVSQTAATWLTEKDNVGRANIGAGTSGPFAFGGVVPAADIFPGAAVSSRFTKSDDAVWDVVSVDSCICRDSGSAGLQFVLAPRPFHDSSRSRATRSLITNECNDHWQIIYVTIGTIGSYNLQVQGSDLETSRGVMQKKFSSLVRQNRSRDN